MKLSNLDYVFKTLDGENITKTIKASENGKVVDGKVMAVLENGHLEVERITKEIPITFKDICVRALHGMRKEEKIDGVEKERRGALANKIFNAKKEVEIEFEDDIKRLKELIGKDGSPLIVHQAYQILDSKPGDKNGPKETIPNSKNN